MSEKKSLEALEKERDIEQKIEKTGQVDLDENEQKHKIHMISIIGEVEGHDILGSSSKSTKYEHILPELARIEDSSEIDGLLILLNTMGGDVEAGLAIAEMIASLSKPTVSLVLGGKPFHRRAHCGKHGLFLYCADGNHGHSSGPIKRHGNRRGADL